MSTVNVNIEQTAGGFWSYLERSPGELPASSVGKILKWILQQLDFGNYRTERDSRGEVVSMVIGRRVPVDAPSAEVVEEIVKQRLTAVRLAGLFAEAREGGIEQRYEHLSSRVSEQLTEWSERNTEFHHAFELLKLLGRINKKTFQLEATAIKGAAPESVLTYLRESTQCWLYGLHGASIALSRACLEDALKNSLHKHKERQTLGDLIAAAKQERILDGSLVEMAHSIRRAGNNLLHGETITETESRDALDYVRSITKQLFQHTEPVPKIETA